MLEMIAKSARSIRSHNRAWILLLGLCLGLSLSIFAVLASSTPLPEIKKIHKSVNLPRNYCLGDVASLGTGLKQDLVSNGTQSSINKRIRWIGWIRASASGRYEFSIPENSGQIILNKQQVFARTETSPRPDIIQIELLTNRFYAITVEVPNKPGSTLPLQWLRPDGRLETVPKAYLYPPLANASFSEANRRYG